MANIVNVFGYEMAGAAGAAITANRTRLSPACKSVEEIDAQVMVLKQCLDAVAERMKDAIRKDERVPVPQREKA